MAESLKVLGQSNPLATTLTDLYTVPAATQTVVSSLVICNRSGTGTAFRVSVAKAGIADDNKQYIFYDTVIAGNTTVTLVAGLSLATTDVVRCYATLATLTFSLFGDELS